jgi:hypothetical protein
VRVCRGGAGGGEGGQTRAASGTCRQGGRGGDASAASPTGLPQDHSRADHHLTRMASCIHYLRSLGLWAGAPGPRHAIAVRRPTHRRAASAGDKACSTRCRQLERLPWCSPPARTACRRHAPCSVAYCLGQLPWCSRRAGTVLPPPCTTQYPVSPSAPLEQSSCWQRLPPAVRLAVPADLEQRWCWHRLPPPCAMQ